MRVIRCKDYDDMSRKTANIISAQVILKPNAKLGLATGTTPIGAYEQLIKWYNKGDVDFAEVTTYNLDEYLGLSGDDKQSYRYFMDHTFFNHINIDKANTHVPNGAATDPEAACRDYDELMAQAGSLDLQLLGIGRNGHVGFNEPGDSFSKGTHVVELAQSTIEANSRLFDHIDQVPKKALSMGVQNIMSAKTILVAASGADKAQAVRDMIEGPVSPRCTASILQLHADCFVVADEAALSLCK
jgi:glucosamine-6-phosphate deaminase